MNNTYTKEQIEEKVREIWKECAPKNTYKEDKIEELEVSIEQDCIILKLSNMYSAPGLSFKHLKKLSEFFETDNINNEGDIIECGCETCDYGSSYGFVLWVRPE